MKGARSYFFKLLIAALVAQGIRAIWDLAEPIRMPLWIAIGALFVLWILPHPGYPVYWIWKKYMGLTKQSMRFFQGLALFLLAIALYQQIYLEGGFTSFYPETTPFFSGNAQFWALGALVSVLIGFIPAVSELLFGLWMKLAHVLSAVVSRILLTVIYILTVLPVALLAAIVRKKFLIRRPDASLPSYWIDRTEDFPQKESYERMF